MEGFLETLIPILIGLTAYLINILGKKRKEKNYSGNHMGEQLYHGSENDEDNNLTKTEIHPPNTSDYEDDEEEENHFQNRELTTLSHQHNKETQPPDFLNDEKEEKEEKILRPEPETHLNKQKKTTINLRKAIIYSAIINRKYT